MATTIKDSIIAELDRLPEAKLAEVLDFVKEKETSSKLSTGGHFQFLGDTVSKDDLDWIEQKLEEGRKRSRENMPKGATFEDLQFLIGAISKEDLDIMEKVIEEDCRQINYESW